MEEESRSSKSDKKEKKDNEQESNSSEENKQTHKKSSDSSEEHPFKETTQKRSSDIVETGNIANETIYKNEIPEQIKICILEPNELTKANYTVEIIDAKVVRKGLLSFKYVEFTITTSPFKWEVKRRFTDFESYSEGLKKLFPGCAVPKLYHTKKGSRFDDKNINWRKRNLQKFLTEISLSPILGKALITYSFLKEEIPSDLKRKIDDMKKEPIPVKLVQFKSVDGQANIKYTEKQEKSCENYGKYILSSSTHFINAVTKLKNIRESFNVIANNVRDLTTDFHNLSDLHNQAGDKNGCQQYLVLENGFKSLEQVYRSQSTMFDEKLTKQFRYFFHELDSLHRVFRTWEESSLVFKKASKELESIKDKTYNGKLDFSKWTISDEAKSKYTIDQIKTNKALAYKELFPKKTEEVEAMRDMYGYFTNRMFDEFERIFYQNYDNLKSNTVSICKWYYGSKSELSTAFKTIGVELMKDPITKPPNH